MNTETFRSLKRRKNWNHQVGQRMRRKRIWISCFFIINKHGNGKSALLTAGKMRLAATWKSISIVKARTTYDKFRNTSKHTRNEVESVTKNVYINNCRSRKSVRTSSESPLDTRVARAVDVVITPTIYLRQQIHAHMKN